MTEPTATPERTLPPLIFEQMTNEVERDVVRALAALACSHFRWLAGTDPSVNPFELSDAELSARFAASADTYVERARVLIDVGATDAMTCVQSLLERAEKA